MQTIRRPAIPTSARCLHLDDRKGSIQIGKDADLVVLDRDLFKISHQDFNRVKVLETVLNGVTVYRAETL